MMPTGQAQTRRRMPPIAEAKPKTLPTISRHRMCELPIVSWASKRRSSQFMREPPWWWIGGGGAVGRAGEEPLDVLREDVDLEVDGVADGALPEGREGEGGGDERDAEGVVGDGRDGEADAVDGDRALLDDVAREVGREA